LCYNSTNNLTGIELINERRGMIDMKYFTGKIISESKVGSKEIVARMAPPVGKSEDNFICGKCSTMLVKGFIPAEYKDKVLKCSNCGGLNIV
jgi:hypothetical protein